MNRFSTPSSQTSLSTETHLSNSNSSLTERLYCPLRSCRREIFREQEQVVLGEVVLHRTCGLAINREVVTGRIPKFAENGEIYFEEEV